MATTVIRRKDFLRPKSNKLQSYREKAKSSTQSSTEKSGKSGKPGKNALEMPEMPETPVDNSVDVFNKSQSNEKFITQETVESKDGRKVKISVYRIGKEEKVEGNKVVMRAKLKFVISYRNVVKECVDDCSEAISKVASATDYKVSKKAISEKIAELREEYSEEEEISIVDYVRQKYPDRLAEIEKDPFEWILSHTKEIVGYDRLKLLTLLSIISSRMKRIMGISRIHLNIVGQSGAGKSSVVKSVLKFVADDMKVDATRFTEKSLGYLDIDSFDGKVVFLEQIDNQNIAYLREAMSEEKICTYVTEKTTDENGNEKHVTTKKCIDGQPAFITTSVSDRVDLDREQIANRMLNVYLKYEYSKDVIETIINRAGDEVSDIDRMVFTAYLLTRPDIADVTPVKDEIIAFTDKLAELTHSPVNRTAEIIRNLVRAVAIAKGKTKADVNDFNFVMQNFQLDILYNGLGLTERDVEIIEALPDEGGLKSQEVADTLKVSKQYAINVLKNLERKGVVEGEKADGKTFTWYLTALGRRIKALVNNIDKDVVEVRDEKGELTGVADAKFRDDANAGNDRTNAMPRNGANRMSGVDEKDDRVIEAYKYLKKRGWTLVAELTFWFGDEIIEELKKKDLVTFNTIDGVEYVSAK
jgi:predicted transcriptional regulator